MLGDNRPVFRRIFDVKRADTPDRRIGLAHLGRAEGKEEAQKITARADREKVVLVADAKRKSEILRGEGEGQRITTLADAYGRDPEFFDFYKSMQEYRNSLGGDSTTMVLTPDSDFFRFFGQEEKK